MTTPRSTYLPAIDGLRAFAVGAVLLFHADHLSGGFLGVDTFFVLSGFLITRQMLHEVDRSGRVSLRDFWARRARRLLPALLLLISVVTLAVARWGYADERIKVRADAPWALGFALNWHHIVASSDYWTSRTSPSPLTHVWSLAVEEQFYLVWPLVVVLLIWRRRNRERSVLIGSIIGAALSFALMAVVYAPGSTTRAYEGTDTRIGALLVGALCATTIVFQGAERVAVCLGRWVGVFIVVPTAVLAWMWLRVDGRDSWLYHGGFALHAVLVALLLLAVSAPMPTAAPWLQQLLRLRPMRWFGQLSYGLYLWHWPIYVALNKPRTHLSVWPLTALRVAVTLAAATLSYYCIEKPVRYGLQRRALPLTALLSVGAISAVFVAVLVIPVPSSGPAEINLASLADPAAVAGAPDATVDLPTTTSSIAANPPGTDGAISTPSAAVPKTSTTITAPLTELHDVVWLGDSIAFTTSPGVKAALAAIGIELTDGSFPGVGMLNDTGPAFFQKVTELTTTVHPQLVIFELSTWDEPFGEDAIYGALRRLRDMTSAAGAHLLLIPPPPLRDLPEDEYKYDVAAGQRIAADDPANVTYLSTTPFWGTTFRLDLDGDKVPERMTEGVHLCPSGSARFAIWLLGQLAADYANVSVADVATWAVGDWNNDPRYAEISGVCSKLP